MEDFPFQNNPKNLDTSSKMIQKSRSIFQNSSKI